MHRPLNVIPNIHRWGNFGNSQPSSCIRPSPVRGVLRYLKPRIQIPKSHEFYEQTRQLMIYDILVIS